MTLIDTNVLLDLVTDDPNWVAWSTAQLDAAALRGPLLINDIVYAELSVRFSTIETLDAPMPRAALFLAGKAFQLYRRRGGQRSGVLPDFFIGAHAAVAGLDLLTRDIGRYGTYFPTLTILSP